MKKNVAIIIPKLTGGGAERVAAKLSIILSKYYNPHLIVFNDKNITYEYSGKLITLNYKKKKNFIGKIFTFIKRTILIKKIKKKYNITHSISFLEYPNFINVLSKYRDKRIISVRIYKSATPNTLYGKLNKFLMKILYNRAEYIVAVSNLIKEDLINNFKVKPQKIKVIYNSYDVKKINKLANEPLENEYDTFFEENIVISNMGRLENQKGQRYLIKAFAEVKKKIPNIKLLIIGDGTLRDELYDLVKNLDITNDVKFVGFTNNPFKYISRSNLFVFPSLYEGFPNALCEAMACGVPVISSDCKSGPREILYNKSDLSRVIKKIEKADYGLLVPISMNSSNSVDDKKYVQDLSKAMLMMIINENLRKKYSENSLIRVNDFSNDINLRKWIKILEN